MLCRSKPRVYATYCMRASAALLLDTHFAYGVRVVRHAAASHTDELAVRARNADANI